MSDTRNTIKAAMDRLRNRFETKLVADPPTLAKPFRKVIEGDAGAVEHARPFVTIRAGRSRPIGVSEDDKLIEVTIHSRIVTDVTEASPNDALFDKVAAVDDYFDGIIEAGLLAGVDGLDHRTWVFGYPESKAGARVASAECTQSFVVRVAREANQ